MGDFDAGMKVRRAVLGDAYVDRSMNNATDFNRPFQHWITENVWGDLWTDDTLDRKTRSMITIAILAALGREEMALHLRGSLNTGVTDEELQQVFQHVAVYAGVPAALSAFNAAKTARVPQQD
jgi:4-carboxymuconolactone decarboxylase